MRSTTRTKIREAVALTVAATETYLREHAADGDAIRLGESERLDVVECGLMEILRVLQVEERFDTSEGA